MNEAAPAPLRYVERGAIRIHYTVHGAGPALILLHGGGPGATGHSNYQRNIASLAVDFTTYVIDFPGWGRSSKNLDALGDRSPFVNGARAVRMFMDELGIDQAHLVGNSFGGSAAFYLAMEDPARVDRLITMGPGGAWIEGNSGPTEGIRQIMGFYLGEGPTREKLAAFLNNLVHDTSVVTDALIDARLAAASDPEIAANPPLRPPPGPPPKAFYLTEDPRLRTLPHRSLLIWGQQDRVNLPVGVQSFSIVPHQDIVMLAQCGHWAQWEQADAFNGLVKWFLHRA